MAFIALAGLDLANFYFYASGLVGDVNGLPAEAGTPVRAKIVDGVSLFLLPGVIRFGCFLPILGDAL
jgi:hypothetical protein